MSAADRCQDRLYPPRWRVKIDPFAVVEEQLGSVDIWASSVLTIMFSGDEPNVRASRRFGAFMYGNGFGASDAVKLYMACLWPMRPKQIIQGLRMYGKIRIKSME